MNPILKVSFFFLFVMNSLQATICISRNISDYINSENVDIQTLIKTLNCQKQMILGLPDRFEGNTKMEMMDCIIKMIFIAETISVSKSHSKSKKTEELKKMNTAFQNLLFSSHNPDYCQEEEQLQQRFSTITTYDDIKTSRRNSFNTVFSKDECNKLPEQEDNDSLCTLANEKNPNKASECIAPIVPPKDLYITSYVNPYEKKNTIESFENINNHIQKPIANKKQLSSDLETKQELTNCIERYLTEIKKLDTAFSVVPEVKTTVDLVPKLQIPKPCFKINIQSGSHENPSDAHPADISKDIIQLNELLDLYEKDALPQLHQDWDTWVESNSDNNLPKSENSSLWKPFKKLRDTLSAKLKTNRHPIDIGIPYDVKSSSDLTSLNLKSVK
jgi:hypothetical protein